jgi:hypothetical protein
MNDSDRAPIDPALIGALQADFQHVPTEARARVVARLTSSVGALSLNRDLRSASLPSVSDALRNHALGFVVSFALGGLCGAGLHGALRAATPERVVYVERPLPAAAPPPAPLDLSNAAAPPSGQPPARKPPSAVSSASQAPNAPAHSATWAEQQALLDEARAAFARADFPKTLALLKMHALRFPKSVLAEERSALEIKALASNGRMAEAKARAVRFAAAFPQSLLLPSINDSLGEKP